MSEGTTVTSTESIVQDRKPVESTDKEFENLISRNLPNWTAFWNFLVKNNTPSKNEKTSVSQLVRPSKNSLKKDDNDTLQKIQNKIAELVREEEALVELYLKAADVAHEREEEFKDKTNVLIGQIKKDKHLMKFIKNTF